VAIKKKPAAKTKAGKAKPAKKPAAKTATKKSTAKITAVKKTAVKKSPAKRPVAKKAVAKVLTGKKGGQKAVAAKQVSKKKAPVKKVVAKKASSKTVAAKKIATKKAVVKKTALKKPIAKKAAVKKPVAKKTAAKKPVAKYVAVKNTAVKKTAIQKSVAKVSVKKPASVKTAPKIVSAPTVESIIVETTEQEAAPDAEIAGTSKSSAVTSVATAPQTSVTLLGIPEQMRDAALKVLDERQAEDIVTVSLAGRSSVADYMIIASGRAGRQVAAIADYLREAFYKLGCKQVRIEGLGEANWVLIDAGDVIVHLFRPEVRTYYDLDSIWNAPHSIQTKRPRE
jgi:ribosome silencing factor RsfS/YbeB/iojap